MRKPFLYLIILILSNNWLLAQTIHGKINSEYLASMANVNILIKNAETPDLISEFTTSKQDGSYFITLKSNFETIIVEFIKFGYDIQTFQFRRSELGKEFKLDVAMKESKVELEEIIIREKPKIEVKEDTVSYKASAFLDGSERKVEDLLKKLPGIQVDSEGKIKYKGKAVEKVLLEGDDLFDYNYTVGTKNINVDVVEQVQAIENFTENPLLRGIYDSEKVALNLKLKKGVIDFSGEGLFGYGIENRHYTDLNALTVTKRIKNFSTITYNNIGENLSPYDYFSFKFSPEDSQNELFKSPKLIQERIFSSGLDSNHANINDNWFTNFNNIYKFSNRLSARINLSYYQDELNFYSSDYSNFTFDNGSNLATSQEEQIRKKPEQYDGSVKLTWNSSKTSLLEYASKWSDENIRTRSDMFVNENSNASSSLNSESFFTKQELLFTQKLNARNVLQLKGVFSRSDMSQQFVLKPSLDFTTGEINYTDLNTQKSRTYKNYWEAGSTFIGAKNKNKFQFSASIKYWQSDLQSTLYHNENLLGNDYKNDLKFNLLETKLDGFYNLSLGKLSIKPVLQIKNYIIDTHDMIMERNFTENHWVIAPGLLLNYKLNDIMRLFAIYSYDETPPQETNQYSGYVLTTNHNIRKNGPDLALGKIQSVVFGYARNDMYNQFSMNASVNYSEQKNNFFARTNVTENLTTIEYFFLPEGNKNFGANLSVEKYLPFIQTTFRLSGTYSRSEYKNIVNNSDLRTNFSDFYLFNFYGKTAFDIPINLQNELKLAYSISKSQNTQESFKNTLITNSFKILIKPNRFWFSSVSFDYFQPSTQNRNEYYFLDAMIRYQSPNKTWEFTLTGKNLTNNKFFEETYISDYYKSTFTQSLNKAYIILAFSFNF